MYNTTGEALLMDHYECITMARSYWRHHQDDPVTFELFVRRLPPNRAYLVVAGLASLLEHLDLWHFSADDLAYLRDVHHCEEPFLEYLSGMRFTGDLAAIPEGTLVGPEVPLLRLTCSRIQGTLLESAVLPIIQHQTMIASKAARIVEAAAGRPVADFSLRRLPGPGAAFGAARAAYLAGCASTASLLAGKHYGIPTSGTLAHAYIQMFGPEREEEAFVEFLQDFADQATLLVDTYDTPTGVANAISASRQTGIPLHAIRLDSGDLAAHAKASRLTLDAAGFTQTQILASDSLDEFSIQALLAAGAPINAFGVGTRMGTSADAPSLDAVYKLVSQQVAATPTAVMKVCGPKSTNPGAHQVYRHQGADTIALIDEILPGIPLLCDVLIEGKLVAPQPTLVEGRAFCAEQRSLLPDKTRRIQDFTPLQTLRSPRLTDLRETLIAKANSQSLKPVTP